MRMKGSSKEGLPSMVAVVVANPRCRVGLGLARWRKGSAGLAFGWPRLRLELAGEAVGADGVFDEVVFEARADEGGADLVLLFVPAVDAGVLAVRAGDADQAGVAV